MSEHKLNDLLRDHYRASRLRDDQLKALQGLQTARRQPQLPRWFGAAGWLAAAAALALMMGPWGRAPILERIADEVSYNHAKGMAPEYAVADYAAAAQALDRLDFTLVAPERLRGPEWEMVGARYCSLQGRIAAQIQLQHTGNGRRFTLYQALPGSELAPDAAGEWFQRGSRIEVWQERGLLMGLAGPAE